MLTDSTFNNPASWGLLWPYRSGSIWLGRSRYLRRPVGVDHNRHCLTIAGSRAGKGVSCFIPNLFEWPESALVIDPKGENAAVTAAYRRDVLGQAVYVLDPFDQVPGIETARYNPLAALDPNSIRIVEDIYTIVDGLIIPADPRHAFFDDGAKTILAGLIAHLITKNPERATLTELRRLITRPDLKEELAPDLGNNTQCGGLPRTAGTTLLDKEAGAFLAGAKTNTKWLDSMAMPRVLSDSTFTLDQLKAQPTTIYLVLPPNDLEHHGRFLRLFVRLALQAMARDLNNPARCLFLLDEFYSLGYMSEIDKAAGQLAGYGVKLWPFVQDITQLQRLYSESWQTFVSNAGTVQFFGNTDPATLDFLAGRLGRDPKYRYEPSDLAHYLRLEPEMKVARRMICLIPGAVPALSLLLTPYFRDRYFRGKAAT